MRAVSQIVVAVLMVGAVIVATAIYGYISTAMLTTYSPSSTSISRVGGVDVNLIEICSEIICGGGLHAHAPIQGIGLLFPLSSLIWGALFSKFLLNQV